MIYDGIIIGGGPAGMYAALACAERGHKVTLFEKNAQLGGLLEYADHVRDFKWPLANYKNWLIAQCEKNPAIEIKLNTPITPCIITPVGDPDYVHLVLPVRTSATN